MKNFDEWNEIIKQVENKQNVNFHEREIWWCRLGLNVGHEQDGKGNEYVRPVLVVRKFNRSACLAVPLTTKQKNIKYYAEVSSADGLSRFAIISQVRFVDSRRFKYKIGYANEQSFAEIKRAIKNII